MLALLLGALLAIARGAPATFEEIASRTGLEFILRNSASGQKYLPETMAGGVAVLDYDNDGRPDLFFCNGARLPDLVKVDPSYHNRLYRNNGDGTFTDATDRAGVASEGYSIGAAAGDFDNDGRTDLFVAGVRRQILYHNRGDGTFEDMTALAGVDSDLWCVAGGWFDYDGDGFLDLFVVRYVAWDPAAEPVCNEGELRTYCHPRFYRGLPNALYRNNRDGTFTDVSQQTGIAGSVGKGMAVAFADYDLDGDLDIFVTNDSVPNFLFRNDAGLFRQVALEVGVAFNDDGRALSSMGVDFRDYDNDERPDIFVTALANETFPLFHNTGRGLFQDRTYPARVARSIVHVTGWSNAVLDLNNDGHKDLFTANGDVQDNTERFSSRNSRQPCTVLLNQGDGTFADGSADAGASFQSAGMHRGAAFADFDADGRVDLVVTRLNERAQLFRNASTKTHHWLSLRLVGRRSNRDAIGARVRVVGSTGPQQWNHVTTAVGYASSSDSTLHFGLGKAGTVKLVEIRWPSGTVQRLERVAPDRRLTIAEP